MGTNLAEEWANTPVVARVALITSVIDDVKTEDRRYGSASWDNVPERLQQLLAPILIPNTDASDRNVKAGWADGKPVYRASMAGRCVKELWLWRIGAGGEFDSSQRDEYRDKGWLAAGEGNIHESLMVEALRGEGFEITGTGDDQEELELRFKRFVIRSHPDGLIRGMEIGPAWRVLECKALSEDRFNLWKSQGWSAFRNYAVQVSLEMYLATKKYETPVLALFVVKNRNTGETVRALIDRYPIDPAQIINRFSEIENVVAAQGGMDCDPDAEWYFCPFLGKGHCDAIKKKDGTVASQVDDPTLLGMIDRMKAAKRTIKEATDEASALRYLIRERMIEPVMRVGPYLAKVSVRTRRGFDIPAAKNFIESRNVDPSIFDKETTYEELRITGGTSDSADNAFED